MRILTLILGMIIILGCSKEEEDPELCWAYIDSNWEEVELSSMPEYLGDSLSFYEVVIIDLSYPLEARENDIEGRVILQYEINIRGEVENRVIIQDIGGGCGEEVLRVHTLHSQGMAFRPAEYEGLPVRVRKAFPVTFKLE